MFWVSISGILQAWNITWTVSDHKEHFQYAPKIVYNRPHIAKKMWKLYDTHKGLRACGFPNSHIHLKIHYNTLLYISNNSHKIPHELSQDLWLHSFISLITPRSNYIYISLGKRFRSSFMVLRPIFRPWPSCFQGFKAAEFLQGGNDSTTYKPQKGAPRAGGGGGGFSFSCSKPVLKCVALPCSYAAEVK